MICKIYNITMFIGMIASLFCSAMIGTSYARDYDHYAEECDPLKGVVIPILRENGIEDKYFYLMVAESHCKDKTGKSGERSHWQIMPRTARKYGCEDFDDLECMTKAAASYLKKIQSIVGKDEEAVVCSWNMGRRNYQKSGSNANCKGLLWMLRHFMKTDETGI